MKAGPGRSSISNPRARRRSFHRAGHADCAATPAVTQSLPARPASRRFVGSKKTLVADARQGRFDLGERSTQEPERRVMVRLLQCRAHTGAPQSSSTLLQKLGDHRPQVRRERPAHHAGRRQAKGTARPPWRCFQAWRNPVSDGRRVAVATTTSRGREPPPRIRPTGRHPSPPCKITGRRSKCERKSGSEMLGIAFYPLDSQLDWAEKRR